MTYSVLLGEDAREYLDRLDDKSERIVRDNLGTLAEEPYPGPGSGDKAEETIQGRTVFRLHVGRTHTALYRIDDENEDVRVVDILPIDKAHKLYDR